MGVTTPEREQYVGDQLSFGFILRCDRGGTSIALLATIKFLIAYETHLFRPGMLSRKKRTKNRKRNLAGQRRHRRRWALGARRLTPRPGPVDVANGNGCHGYRRETD